MKGLVSVVVAPANRTEEFLRIVHAIVFDHPLYPTNVADVGGGIAINQNQIG